jgi:hypothetical protein
MDPDESPVNPRTKNLAFVLNLVGPAFGLGGVGFFLLKRYGLAITSLIVTIGSVMLYPVLVSLFLAAVISSWFMGPDPDSVYHSILVLIFGYGFWWAVSASIPAVSKTDLTRTFPLVQMGLKIFLAILVPVLFFWVFVFTLMGSPNIALVLVVPAIAGIAAFWPDPIEAPAVSARRYLLNATGPLLGLHGLGSCLGKRPVINWAIPLLGAALALVILEAITESLWGPWQRRSSALHWLYHFALSGYLLLWLALLGWSSTETPVPASGSEVHGAKSVETPLILEQ